MSPVALYRLRFFTGSQPPHHQIIAKDEIAGPWELAGFRALEISHLLRRIGPLVGDGTGAGLSAATPALALVSAFAGAIGSIDLHLGHFSALADELPGVFSFVWHWPQTAIAGMDQSA